MSAEMSEIRDYLVKWSKLRKLNIIVTGSFAKGTFTSESDVDLLVIVDEFPNFDVIKIREELEANIKRRVSVNVYTVDEIERRIRVLDPYMVNNIRDFIVINLEKEKLVKLQELKEYISRKAENLTDEEAKEAYEECLRTAEYNLILSQIRYSIYVIYVGYALLLKNKIFPPPLEKLPIIVEQFDRDLSQKIREAIRKLKLSK